MGLVATLSVVLACCGCDSGVYRSSAWLRIEREAPYLLVPDTRPQVDLQQFGEDQKALILSPLVLEQVLARPDISQIAAIGKSSRPVELLREHLRFESSGTSETWTLTCEWSDPEEAAAIANAVVESYFRMHTQDHAQRMARTIEFIEDELARQQKGLERLAEQVREMEVKLSETTADVRVRQLREEALRASHLRLREQQDETVLALAELAVNTKDAETTSEAQRGILERRAKAISARQTEVLQELTGFAHNQPTNPDLKAKREELQYAREVFDKLTLRIRQLRTEMAAPARVTLLRRAEPSNMAE